MSEAAEMMQDMSTATRGTQKNLDQRIKKYKEQGA